MSDLLWHVAIAAAGGYGMGREERVLKPAQPALSKSTPLPAALHSSPPV